MSCDCCATGLVRCHLVGNEQQPAFGMRCDGQIVWKDTDGGDVDPADLVDCWERIEVTLLPHPDDWPLALVGARRNRFQNTQFQGIGGNWDAGGTCRDPQGRVVRGPCPNNPAPGDGGAWNMNVNDINVARIQDNGGSGQVWGSVEGWVLVPLAVDPVPLTNGPAAGNANMAVETGTEPANRVLRSPAAGISPFNTLYGQALDRSCSCLAAHGFGFAYIRAMSGDGYNLWSVAAGYDIGGGTVQIPRNRLVPSDANSQVPTDPRTFCADVLPQFYVTVTGWRDPKTGLMFEDDRTTPLDTSGGSCVEVAVL